MEKKKKWVRQLILSLSMAGGVFIFGIWIYHLWDKVPSAIRIRAGVKQELELGVPGKGELYRESDMEYLQAVPVLQSGKAADAESLVVNLNRPVTLMANQEQSYRMDVKLFGVFPLKTVDVEVIEDVQIYPMGIPIGIYIRTDGVLVINEGEFVGENGNTQEPAKYLLQAGDYILKVNGENVADKKDVINLVENAQGEEMILTIRRNQEIFDVKILPQKNEDGEYRLGIWIRDNAQGVGTMTFMTQDQQFGALGHGINDTDTAQLMKIGSGSLYKTEIISVKKGEDGVPGELTGIIDYNLENKIGVVSANTEGGIFGTIQGNVPDIEERQVISIGFKQEVTLGEAQILCCVDGEVVPKSYSVEITGIHLNHDNVNRGMELKVTDEELIRQTGGIVQGMSGSPIIQDGKLVGAVTHVLVNDPTRGYGIFIENMLDAAG